MCREHTTTYHIEDAACINLETGSIRHKPVLDPDAAEVEVQDWLPDGPLQLGITAGASTPNNKVGEAVLRVLKVRGTEPPEGLRVPS
jgi:4-hydroxy-3-methylbut-2-enyl diphosphate reductase